MKPLLLALFFVFFLSNAFALLQEKSIRNVPISFPADVLGTVGGTVSDESGLLYYIASIHIPKAVPTESEIEIGAIDVVTLEKVASYRVPGSELAKMGDREGWWTNGLVLSPSGKLYSVLSRQRLSPPPTIGTVVEGSMKMFSGVPPGPYDFAIFEFPKPSRNGTDAPSVQRISTPPNAQLDGLAYFNGKFFSAYDGGSKNGFWIVDEKTGEGRLEEDSRISNISSLSVSPSGTLFVAVIARNIKDDDKILAYDVSAGLPELKSSVDYNPQKNGGRYVGAPTEITALNDFFFAGTSWGVVETFYPEGKTFEPNFNERVQLGKPPSHIIAMANWRNNLFAVHGVSDSGPELASAVFDSASGNPDSFATKTDVVEEAAAISRTIADEKQLEPALAPASVPLIVSLSFDSGLAEKIESKNPGKTAFQVLAENASVSLDGKTLSSGNDFVFQGNSLVFCGLDAAEANANRKLDIQAKIPPFSGGGITINIRKTQESLVEDGKIPIQLVEGKTA